MLNEELKSKLRNIYNIRQDWIDVLIAMGISADEFEAKNLFEDMTPKERRENGFDYIEESELLFKKRRTMIFDFDILSTYEERKTVLRLILKLYNSNELNRIEELIT